MATCMAMGQGAGVAGALAVKSGCDAAAVDAMELRKVLIGQGAVVDLESVSKECS